MSGSVPNGSLLVLWLLPVSWVLHDLEEIHTMVRWRTANRSRLAALASKSWPARRVVESMPTTTAGFTVAVALVGVLLVGATIAGHLDPRGGGIVLYAVFLGGYCLHGVVHVGQSIVFRGYTPGVASAVLLVIPTSAFLYTRLLEWGVIDRRTLVLTAVTGLVLFVPIAVGANRAATWVENENR